MENTALHGFYADCFLACACASFSYAASVTLLKLCFLLPHTILHVDLARSRPLLNILLWDSLAYYEASQAVDVSGPSPAIIAQPAQLASYHQHNKHWHWPPGQSYLQSSLQVQLWMCCVEPLGQSLSRCVTGVLSLQWLWSWSAFVQSLCPLSMIQF